MYTDRQHKNYAGGCTLCILPSCSYVSKKNWEILKDTLQRTRHRRHAGSYTNTVQIKI